MTAEIEIEIDENHPTIGAFGVCSKQAGYLEVATVLRAFKEQQIPQELYPNPVANGTALKRAMEDCCIGDKTLRVESTGKHSKVVYSIIRTNKERIDREAEDNDGVGVADAAVSARVEANGTGGLSLVIKPDGHHFSHTISSRFEYHREHYKCSEDLSQYLSQRLFKSNLVKATARPGHAGGFYFVPKGEGLNLLRKVDKVFKDLSWYNNKTLNNGVKLYFMPMLTHIDDVLDAIVDSVIDDADRVCDDLEEALHPDSKLGCRALGSKAKSADELLNKLVAFSSSAGVALKDIEDRVSALKKRIVMAEITATMGD